MSLTRREFMKDMAAAGAVVTAGSAAAADTSPPITDSLEKGTDRCPYFDQPLLCKGLSKTGRPLCED